MTNTATLNTSDKNINNYCKMKYGLKKKKKKKLFKTSQHTVRPIIKQSKTNAKLNFPKQRERERERGRTSFDG